MKQIKKWFEPPFFPGDAQKTIKAQLINSMGMYFVAALAVAAFFYVSILATHKLAFWTIILILFGVYLIARYFLFRGRLIAAGIFFIVSGWLICEGIAFWGGGINSPMMFALAAMSIAMGLMFHFHAGAIFLALNVLAGLGFAILQRNGTLVPQYFDYTPLGTWFYFALSLAFINWTIYLTVHKLETALADARQQNEACEKAETILRKSEAKFRAPIENSYDSIIFVGLDAAIRHGTWNWIDTTAQNVLENPDEGEIIVTNRGITERKQIDEALNIANKRFEDLLNSIDQLIYVADIATYETLFVNNYGKEHWGEIQGKICWQAFQQNMSGPCEFCTNKYLIGSDGKPKDIYVWEFQNTINRRWYECHDRAIYWPDGRLVRIEVASDITDRKSMEDTLRNSEKKYRAIIEASPVPYALNDERQNIVLLNSAFVQTFGYTIEDIPVLAEWWSQAYPDPEYRQWVASTWQACLEKSKRENTAFEPMEVSIRCKDGSTRIVLANAASMGDSFSDVHLVTLYDITARKSAEIALRESEQEFKTLVENTPDIIARFDRNYRYVFVNKAYEAMAHRPVESLLGKSHREVGSLPEKQMEWSEQVIRGVLESGQPVEFETSMLGAKGLVYLNSRGVPEFNERGEVKSALFIHRDITTRKLAEEALRASEAEEQAILNAIPDFMFDVDQDGRIFNYHAPAHENLYVHPEQFIGKTAGEFMPPSAARVILDALKEAERQGWHRGGVYSLETPGGVGWYELNIQAKENGAGAARRYVALVHNITERKCAEERIGILLQEKEILLREVHHRIKNNMSTITSMLDLQAHSQDDPGVKRALQDAGARVQSMVVLYYKLYRAKNFRAISIRLYIPPLMQQILGIFPEQTHIKVKTQLEDIILSPKSLHPLGIILNELATNAMKYAFAGRSEGEITITASSEDQTILITFADNGVGLPDDFNLEKSAGFGMQLVGLLITQLQGAITVERNNGAKFTLKFIPL